METYGCETIHVHKQNFFYVESICPQTDHVCLYTPTDRGIFFFASVSLVAMTILPFTSARAFYDQKTAFGSSTAI